MQAARASKSITDSKPKLFVVIFAFVVALFALPVILPHITHTNMIYHILLHIFSLVIAIFLSAVSILAYRRNGTTRLLFMTLGFLSLVVIELLYLFYATINIEEIIIPIVQIELPHIILFAMLAMFGIGVFKVNSKP
jgi:hypothetical protein